MSRLTEAYAIDRLRRGLVGVNATEGVFGLCGRAFDLSACARIAALKRRSTDKSFIVVVADFAQIESVVKFSSTEFMALPKNTYGAETWILPASAIAPSWLLSTAGTIGVRVTRHPQFARLCKAAGPLVSTSANLPGRSPALNLLRARRYFADKVDFYLPGRLINPGRVSTIRDARTSNIIR